MAHRNMVMRDPLIYRIRHSNHYRQGDSWPIYPMYDFAHCLSDSVERVTHSLCTLEFENNREIYDWLLEHVDAPVPRPEQTEFAPLVLDYVITSKRKLKELVRTGHMRGWDDPRMPTLAGLRRRGVTPEAIRTLCDMVGVARAQSRVDFGKFDFAVRDDLNHRAPRAFCVLEPLRVVLTNYPAEREEIFRAPRMPGGGGEWGTRELPFGRELYIDREDFAETPPPGFHRLRPGGEVRLKYACTIRCDTVARDGAGRVTELRCSFDPATVGGAAPKGRRVRGVIHWLRADRAVPAEVRLIDRMFSVAEPPPDDIVGALNPESERVVAGALVEPGVAGTPPGTHCQFERHGYFFSDPVDSRDGRLVFNRTVTLRDSWGSRTRAEVAGMHGSRASVSPGGSPGDGGGSGRRMSPEESLSSDEDRRRFRGLRSLGVGEAAAASLVRLPAGLELFGAAVARYPEGADSIAAWLVNDFTRLLGSDDKADSTRLEAAAMGELARAVDTGELSHRQGRTVLAGLLQRGGSFAEVRSAVDLTEIGDGAALRAMLEELVNEFPNKAAAYRAGRTGLLGFFVGQVMRRTEGKADPRAVSRLAEAILSDQGD